MAITHKSTDQSFQQTLTDATKESTATAGQAGLVVINPDGSNVGGGGGGGGAVTIADGANVAQGTTTDAAYTSGSGTTIGLLKGVFTRLRGGQATMANSLPVVVSSDQSAVPVSSTDGGQVTIGATTDAAYTSGSGTVLAVLKGIFTKLAGTLTVVEQGYSTISGGRTTVTTAGTRVTLAASTACKRVVLTALSSNTGTIAIGGTGVVAAVGTRQGTPLLAGDTFELFIDDLNKINLDATVSAEGVSYTYFS